MGERNIQLRGVHLGKLSAVLIVRNESPRLPRCLKSIRHHVDEVVILDTGSTDDTIDVARKCGADVVVSEPDRTVDLGDGFRTLGDFAAARNRALGLASGTHLLVVDADHVYCPPTFLAIRQVMQDDSVHAASLRYHIAPSQRVRPADVVTGAKRMGQPFNSVALLRAHATDREYYYGTIHEVTTPWIERRTLDGTRQVVLRDSRIADYGHESGTRRDLGKDERNRRLLERAIALNPDDPAPYTYLAATYLQLQDFDRTADLIADVYDKVGKDPRLSGSHLLRLCVTMGLLGFNVGRPDMTWRAAQMWDENDPRLHPDILIVKGLACEQMGKVDEAVGFYRVALRTSCDSVGSQHIIGSTAQERLDALQANQRTLIQAP